MVNFLDCSLSYKQINDRIRQELYCCLKKIQIIQISNTNGFILFELLRKNRTTQRFHTKEVILNID